MAPFLSGGGYSSEALSFVLGLSRLMPQLRIAQFAEPVSEDFVDGLGAKQMRALEAIAQRRAVRGARTIVICHSTPDAWVPSRFEGWDDVAPCPPASADISIGRTMYESDRLPSDWVVRCNRLDEIWVPTSFHRDSFQRSGVDAGKIFVVPEPVDVDWFDPEKHLSLPLPFLKGPPHPFVFLSVFKWEKRKGWDVLLRAFLAEFGSVPTGDVGKQAVLVVKTSPFYSSSDFGQLIANYTQSLGLAAGVTAKSVHVLDEQLSFAELPRLYNAADAFVLPSRGEGWGRPHAEAMAMGLPTIATAWSGPTAFMTEENSFPVRVAQLVPVETDDEVLREEGHLWAEPDLDHLRARMREVFDDREGAVMRGRRARADMARLFSPKVVGEAVRARLEQLAAAAPSRPSHHGDSGRGRGHARVTDEL